MMLRWNKTMKGSLDQGEKEASSRILVVEDDADLLLVVATVLGESYQVITAVDGRDGLDKALEQEPDLVVTDLMMPVMDGIALCRALKEHPATAHVPVIILTAKTSVESQLEGLETGADDYVTKPFLMELLEARIENLLHSRRQLRERFGRAVAELNPAVPEGVTDRVFYEKAAGCVAARLADSDYKPEDLAADMNMSLRSLQRKLKAEEDRTPLRFIHEVRMAEAAQRLKNGSLTITEIAYEVGFTDASNFSKMFRQMFDHTPSEFRDIHCSK